MNVKIFFDISDFNDYIDTNIKVNIPKALIEGTNKSVSHLLDVLLTKHLRGGTTSTKLRTRSGNLRSQTQPIPSKSIGKNKASGGIQFGAKYSKVHINVFPTTTIIRPKRARNLAIPIEGSPATTGSGVKNYFGDIRQQFPFLSFAYSKRGTKLLVDRRGGRFIPYFVLKRQVAIQSRVHLDEILNREAIMFEEIYRKAIKLLLNI